MNISAKHDQNEDQDEDEEAAAAEAEAEKRNILCKSFCCQRKININNSDGAGQSRKKGEG